MKSFHGGKHYNCESCGQSFSRAESLKKHIHTVHEGHRDYKCESCGKSFSQAGHLKTHVSTVHEGRKDFKCESCSKSFSQVGTLKTHINRIHGSAGLNLNQKDFDFTTSSFNNEDNGIEEFKCL